MGCLPTVGTEVGTPVTGMDDGRTLMLSEDDDGVVSGGGRLRVTESMMLSRVFFRKRSNSWICCCCSCNRAVHSVAFSYCPCIVTDTPSRKGKVGVVLFLQGCHTQLALFQLTLLYFVCGGTVCQVLTVPLHQTEHFVEVATDVCVGVGVLQHITNVFQNPWSATVMMTAQA